MASVSRKRRAKALRAFVARLTCRCGACYWWRNPLSRGETKPCHAREPWCRDFTGAGR
jgi:hypothetical protein